MGAKEPITKYRPTRTRSGGGYAETLGSSTTIWGRFFPRKPPHQEEVLVGDVDINEDVEVGDILIVEE